MFNKVIYSLALLFVTSCSMNTGEPAETAEQVAQRPHNQAARHVSVPVPLREYTAAARNVDMLRRLRLVEIVASEEVGRSAFPEYRLFNVEPKSPYALLGLEEGDILVSANDYVLRDPERFRQYVQVLYREQGDTFVEIRRAGEEVVLKFEFVN